MKWIRSNSQDLSGLFRKYIRVAVTALIWSCVGCFVSACFDGGYAPVTQAGIVPKVAPYHYRVQSGDTLYSIAWTYGLDIKTLARINHLSSSYQIWSGQSLTLKQQVINRPMLVTKKSSNFLQNNFSDNQSAALSWGWPVKGYIIQYFKPGFAGNAGIDIAGFLGEIVHAAASGVVVYSGDGVRGYGNLIIIKHGEDYLSAYAFNQKNLVQVGDRVHQGQQVAVMGTNNEGRAVLHFEIRHNGQPINPMQILR